MEFKEFFSILKSRISDGHDVPVFFRDLFSMITDVPEDEWGTPQDPATNKTKDDSLRSYAKRTIPQKFAQKIVYRLSTENFIESINSRPSDTRKLLADDFSMYDATINETDVADKLAELFVEIIRKEAGLVKKSALAQQKQHQIAVDLKSKYGQYLLNEVNHSCPFPGCGHSLTKTKDGKTIDLYEVSLIDKTKAPEISNLLALCPNCYGTYILDGDKKVIKQLIQVKKLLDGNNYSKTLIDDINLEKGIIGVLHKVKNLKQIELVEASMDPKEIKKKLDPDDNFTLYAQVNFFVSTYFIRIRNIMINMDKSGDIDYEEIQDQMKAIYRKLKKSKKSNMEIFNTISDKIHRVSLQEIAYCQIVTSYFIQSCEVFDAITK